MAVERISLQHVLTSLRIGLAVIPMCIGVISNSLAQERLDHGDFAPAADVASLDAFVKLPVLLAERVSHHP